MTERQQFEAAFMRAADRLGIAVTAEALAGMWAHFARVVETNQRFNLTRVTAPMAAAVKLYADSLAPAAWIDEVGARVRTCLDVGTGAGFPAVPLALFRPAWRVTAVDATGKKAAFVAACASEIPIPNLRAVHERAGEGRPRDRFDLVLLKAVGELAKCLSFAAGRVAPNGCVIVFKGRSLTRAELDAGQARAEELRMQTWDTVDYELPCGGELLEHSLIVYKRVG